MRLPLSMKTPNASPTSQNSANLPTQVRPKPMKWIVAVICFKRINSSGLGRVPRTSLKFKQKRFESYPIVYCRIGRNYVYLPRKKLFSARTRSTGRQAFMRAWSECFFGCSRKQKTRLGFPRRVSYMIVATFPILHFTWFAEANQALSTNSLQETVPTMSYNMSPWSNW